MVPGYLNSFVQDVRKSQREVIRELGCLRSHRNSVSLSYSQCHALIEIRALGPLNVRHLSRILRLDKSTTSRIVSSLVQRDLVRAKTDQNDSRNKILEITNKGRLAIDRVDEEANAEVHSAMECLGETEQEQVVVGLELYSKALRRAHELRNLEIRKIQRKDNPLVAQVIRKVMPEFGNYKEGYSMYDAEVEDMYSAYDNDRSTFYVVAKDRKVLGVAGVGPLKGGDRKTCELRKMYLLSDLRGTGIGAHLLKLLLRDGKKMGYREMYLETLSTMVHANKLYKKHGFKPLKKPMGNTGHFVCDRWYARNL